MRVAHLYLLAIINHTNVLGVPPSRRTFLIFEDYIRSQPYKDSPGLDARSLHTLETLSAMCVHQPVANELSQPSKDRPV